MSESNRSINPDEAAQAAYKDLRHGNLAAARAACRQILDAEPAHVVGLFVLGLVEVQSKNYKDAIIAMTRLTEIIPTAEAFSQLANCHYALGNLTAAFSAARAALEINPDEPGANTNLAAILHGLGRYEEALEAAQRGARIEPTSDVACARVASTLERLGRFDEAQQEFRKARDLGARTKPYSVLSFERKLFEDLAATRRGRAQPAHHHGPLEPTGFRLVALACCDSLYFEKYGYNFVNSFAKNTRPDNLLHVHVVDPAPGLDQTLNKIMQEISVANFVVSTEVSPYEKSVPPLTYYTCTRFLNLPYFLERYKTPIVCIDIDAVLERPLEHFVDSVAGGDIGLFRREPSHSPWLDIPAGAVVANPTEPARRYFEMAGNYMVHFMLRGEAKWHLDQAALYCMLRMMERFGGTRDARLLPPKLNGQIAPEALFRLPKAPVVKWLPQSLQEAIWQIGHEHDYKLGDSRFTRYSSPDGAAPENAS